MALHNQYILGYSPTNGDKDGKSGSQHPRNSRAVFIRFWQQPIQYGIENPD